MFPVAILAGGLATRLRPMTEQIPKCLLEVAGKPFIIHQLDYLREQGIRSVVLCIGYLGEMIEELVGDGSQWNMDIKYSRDGKKLLGTGGAIIQALPMLGKHFFILYGDSYLPINFSQVQECYIRSEKKSLMTVFRNCNKWDASNVELRNDQVIEYNKNEPRPEMQHIDYGLCLIRRSALEPYLSDAPFDLSKVYNDLSITGNMAGFEVYERFYEIGSFDGISATQLYLKNKINKGNT